MKIIEIKALKNGAHRNQTGNLATIPEGWAQIPDDMPIPDTFPFVNIEVTDETRYNEVEHYPIEVDEETEGEEPIIERIPYTVTVVTGMTEGIVPDPVPESEPIPDEEELTAEEMANAILEGVNNI